MKRSILCLILVKVVLKYYDKPCKKFEITEFTFYREQKLKGTKFSHRALYMNNQTKEKYSFVKEKMKK